MGYLIVLKDVILQQDGRSIFSSMEEHQPRKLGTLDHNQKNAYIYCYLTAKQIIMVNIKKMAEAFLVQW